MNNEKNIRPGMKIKMTSYDELCGGSDKDAAIEVEIENVLDNPRNPFKVIDNEEMDELVSSVKQFGIMEPVSVIKQDSKYLLISGHRRKHAALLAGLEKIPVMVLEDLTEEEMDIRMVDANIQRKKLPSEIAHSYKLKYEAMKHQGKDDTESEWSQERLGKEFGMSGRQVQRYLRLNELIDELLDAVDSKQIQLMLAVDISFLNKEIQERIYDAMLLGIKPNQEMVVRLKRIQEAGIATKENVSEVIQNKEHKENRDVNFSEKQLDSYFPVTYGKEERKKVILELLKEWKDSQEVEK